MEESRKKFLCGDSCRSITDDKTVVVAFNADVIPALKEDSYYAEPDWAELQKAWNRKAYPHLYKNEKKEKEPPAEKAPAKEPEQPEPESEQQPEPETAVTAAEPAREETVTVEESEPTEESEPETEPEPTAEPEEKPAKKSGFFNLFKKSKD